MNNALEQNGRALENQFFLREDQRLSESLREMLVLEETSGLLGEVSGIRDPQVLALLGRKKVTPASAASLAILPLVAVAWADGTVDAAEREAILDSLDRCLFFQTVDRDIVDAWLGRRPNESLVVAWEVFVRHLVQGLTAPEKKALARAVLEPARQVAHAAGTFLGFGGTSPGEIAVLHRLERAFGL